MSTITRPAIISSAQRISIEIDNEDGIECPDDPWTLWINADNGEGTQLPLDIGHESAMIGSSIPAMLRELADRIERGEVSA